VLKGHYQPSDCRSDAVASAARPARLVARDFRRRCHEPALQFARGAMKGAGTDLAAAQLGGNCLQECVAALDRKRPGGGHHGVELGIG
jgi:hypothetical protein